MTQAQADARAEEISKSVFGTARWDRTGWPTNSPDVIIELSKTVTISNNLTARAVTYTVDLQTISSNRAGVTDLIAALSDGPVYGYYVGPANANTGVEPAHIIVITGAANAPGHGSLVSSNNPWNHYNLQTFGDFLAGIPGDRGSMTFQGYLRVNPGWTAS